MKKTLFITGGSGFIGTHLLRQLDLEDYRHVYCLCRTESPLIKDLTRHDNFTFIKSDILEPHMYKPYLDLSDIVIHLAAVTGKSRPEEFFDVNVKGLKNLIENCEQFKVKRFLHISSIAAKYSDTNSYYYAQSKRQGEALLCNSTMRFTIVRPTVVLGYSSTIWRRFLDLGRLPFCVVLGDGKVKLQPIYIDDLIDTLIMILNEDVFLNKTYDLGGPEIITVIDFLKRICDVFHQKTFRPVKIPLKYIITILRMMEKRLFSFLPVTAGQLSLFENDSTIDENTNFAKSSQNMKNIDEMLERLKADEAVFAVKKRLKNECRIFCRYLFNEIPSDYIIQKYIDGNIATIHRSSREHVYLDAAIVKLASKNMILNRLADSYTAVFSRNSVFRRKLVLLLAILECCPPVNLRFDIPDGTGKIRFYFRGLLKGAAFMAYIVISIIIFLPIHLVDIILPKFYKY